MPRIGRYFMPNMKRDAMGFMQSGDFPVPVGHWKFGKNTGTVAYDSSPEGNDGEIRGPSWVKGYLGPGLGFDGLDDYVFVPDSASVSPTDEMTVICRVKLRALERVGCVWKSAYNYIFFLEDFGAVYYFVYDTEANTSQGIAPVGSTTVGKWFTLGGVYGSDHRARVFIDGLAVGSVGDAGVDIMDTPGDLYIGKRGDDIADVFINGLMDEVILFDEGLTAAQMLQWHLGYR